MEKVSRFTLVQRLAHWSHVLFTLLLLATGIALYFPFLSAELNRDLLRSVHLVSALGFVLLPVAMLLVSRKPLLKDVRRFEIWDSDDFEWLRRSVRNLLGSKLELPLQGKFNAGMKLNAIFMFTIAVWLCVTGALILLNGVVPLPLQIAESVVFVHDLMTFVLIPVLLGHVIPLLYSEAMRGMIRGSVSIEYARKRHAKWVDDKEEG